MEPRLLDGQPVASLSDYESGGGGAGLEAARRLGAAAVIDEVASSGLRGRGGAGFPTARKWATVLSYGPAAVPKTVVVNGAEGEPGTFKDRSILRSNLYPVVEGALIAALAVGGADRVVIALKGSFTREREAVERAIAEARAADWTAGVVDVEVFAGPEEYLFGEETGLLEVLNGRPPFPRLAPPYRHGADEIGVDAPATATTARADRTDGEGAPPTLVNNVETLANVPQILSRGADWFRSEGTAESPGTIVCTVSGDTQRAGVAEFAMGTPIREIIETVGGGPSAGHRIAAVMSGVANPILPSTLLDTPATYEDLAAAGSGLGSCGFLVFDDGADPVSIAQAVARFLAIESCGQCTPCKGDGLEIALLLDELRTSTASAFEVDAIRSRLQTVTEGARCYLAQQQQSVVESLLRHFPNAFRGHVEGRTRPADPELIAPLADIVDGVASLETGHLLKQPDWSFDETWSGEWPAEEIDVRAETGQPISS